MKKVLTNPFIELQYMNICFSQGCGLAILKLSYRYSKDKQVNKYFVDYE